MRVSLSFVHTVTRDADEMPIWSSINSQWDVDCMMSPVMMMIDVAV